MSSAVFDLDKIFLIPSSQPPHKPDANLAPAADRYDMVRLSIRGLDGLDVSDKELIRKGPSFTIDTIREFIDEYGPDHRFYFLMGSDAFFDISTWKQKDRIFETVPVIIMLRGDTDIDPAFTSFIDENIGKGYTPDSEKIEYVKPGRQKIHICRVPRIDISSTMIRDRIKNNQPITGLVPDAVETIINTKELYQ